VGAGLLGPAVLSDPYIGTAGAAFKG